MILRRFRLSDTPAYHEMMNQPAVERTLIPGPATLADSARHIAMIEGHWDLVGHSFMAVVEKSTGLLIGRVGPWQPYGWPGLEIGWTIHPRRGRRGYAVEAALAACRWTFERYPGLRQVVHTIAPTNAASQRVAKKLGSEKTTETFNLPPIGHIDIWATARSALAAR
ncbi:GNAT family N-acetyltransferase [Parvularcula sp. BGMRC 0090]|uniref:GNAT family N-acetyltransferase n=1 Tax=Parvularcula maris TaxID=2965077 RepID=A0A9X2L6D2_9PROT|nr:GNAT family N-acetyltransferase [Parvularcula maris]